MPVELSAKSLRGLQLILMYLYMASTLGALALILYFSQAIVFVGVCVYVGCSRINQVHVRVSIG